MNIGTIDLKLTEVSAYAARHTSGPWKADRAHQVQLMDTHSPCPDHPSREKLVSIEVHGPDNQWIASVHGEHVNIPLEQIRPNAALIAAAPRLLEACKLALPYLAADSFRNNDPDSAKAYYILRDAILAAESFVCE